MAFVLDNYEDVVAHPVFEELTSSPHLLLEIARAAAQIVTSPAQLAHGCDSPVVVVRRIVCLGCSPQSQSLVSLPLSCARCSQHLYRQE